jgi:DNA polymerase III subunit beta
MKITCDREKLASAFQLAASVAPARSPKEILQNVRITATGKSLMLSATDMEVGIRLEITEGVEIETEGSVLMPVQRTMSILRETTDDTIQIAAVDTQIHIKTNRSKFRLPAANPDEFPQVATFDEDSSYHEIPTRLFREMVRRTVFATDADSSRYALGGVLLELEGESVIAVGTDGRRLARMEGKGVSVGDHKTSGMTTIVPTRAISLMERAVIDSDETVRLTARSNDLLLRTPRCVIYSRLVEGRYPNWRQVFPKRDNASQIDMTIGPLFAALRQAAIVTDHDTRGIEFTFGNGTLKLEANTAQIGESSVEMPIAYDGEEVVLKMDHRFVADFCKVLDNDASFLFEIESSNAPALLSTADGYGYVIMPMARDR